MKNNNNPGIDLKLKGIEISESDKGAFLTLEIPIRFDLLGRRSVDEYQESAIENLRIKALTIFEHIGFLSILPWQTEVEPEQLLGVIYVLSALGQGLIEAQETIEMSFERLRKGEPEAAQESGASRH